MRHVLPWMLINILCDSAVALAQDAGAAPGLVEAQAAYDEAMSLQDAGRYPEAISRAERALTLRQGILGGADARVADCLSLIGEIYRRQGDFARAEPLLLRALSVREEALGKSHPDVATSLSSLATNHYYQGAYGRAEPLLRRAISIQEEALGRSHPDLAHALNRLGTVYIMQGLYGLAEPLLQRSLAIRQTVLGPSHPDVAAVLNNLGVLYKRQGLHGRAESLYQRALAIREATLGPSHPDVAIALINLANVYAYQGSYHQSGPLYERALAIQEATLGESHPDVALTLLNLGNLYYHQGLYRRAEPIYRRALAIQEAALGESHPDMALSLNSLANIYRAQGLNRRAELLHERALAIQEATLGKSHPDVAHSLYSLATLYFSQESYDRAEQFYERALAIQEATFGKSHLDVADSLESLANTYTKQQQYSRAGPLYERALAIKKVAVGKSHPAVAGVLDNLATLYTLQGLYGRAEPLYRRALAIQESVLGKSHPDVADSLFDFARLRIRQRRLAEAIPLLARALAISEGRLRHEALDFSESRMTGLLQLLDENGDYLHSLVQMYPDNADVRRLALTSTLLFKGRSVEEAADTSRTILRSLAPQDRDAFERLRGIRTQLAQLSLDGPGNLAPADHQRRLKRLAEDGDALEADLAKRAAPLRALTALPSAADIPQRVAAALPRESALVEFVTYANSRPESGPGAPESRHPIQLRYLALVLFPDGRTSAADLGPADVIHDAISQLRDALDRRDARFQAAAQELHRLVFGPFQPLLAKTRKVFLAPDSQLALVPFAALHDGRSFLIDVYDFTYLTSGRDLLPHPGDIPTPASIVVFADPDYSASPPVPAPASSSDGDSTLATMVDRSPSLGRFFSEARVRPSGQHWRPLPGTRQEAESIKHLFPQAQVLLGQDASKERLLRLPAPRILHIATHGFFLEDEVASRGDRGLGEPGPMMEGGNRDLPDPLLRSGLILAGASPENPNQVRESFATALELAGLNLWGTELVVLSACDTGRGDVKRGQGVYGLRRALMVAGAETLVVSLWKVDDQVTRILMESYYRNLLAGHGRIAALREAMLAVREQHPAPHYWAPFIAIGRDAPLRQLAPVSMASRRTAPSHSP